MKESCERVDQLNRFYDGHFEDARLSASRQGQLEYTTTMHYVHQALKERSKILEVGAGTGRYSIALAREGHDVTAVELTENNLAVLRRNSDGMSNLQVMQGDALDLSCLADDTYDLTLVLGPLYHLYTGEEQMKALREAVRVTRPGGIIMTAFLSVHAVIFDNYLRGDLLFGLEENFTETYEVKHFTRQLFTAFNIDEFEALFDPLPVDRITTAATDSVLELAEGRKDFAMSDEEFEAFAQYHLHHCERRELLGCSSHLLHICRKRK